jgi:hypothetical protein
MRDTRSSHLSVNRIRRLVGDTAFVGVSAHANVAGFAPGSAPRVLDFPVVRTISSVADSQDTVVKVGAASAAEDTGFVELEARLIGFNGNGHRGDIDGGAEGVFGVGDILVARELRVSGGRAGSGFAYTVLGGVRVGRFSAETVGLDVFEGRVH